MNYINTTNFFSSDMVIFEEASVEITFNKYTGQTEVDGRFTDKSPDTTDLDGLVLSLNDKDISKFNEKSEDMIKFACRIYDLPDEAIKFKKNKDFFTYENSEHEKYWIKSTAVKADIIIFYCSINKLD